MSKYNKKEKYYYLEEYDSCTNNGYCNKIIKDNRTVYVDIKYGNKHGELYKPNCPFNTINGAINTIKNIVKTYKTQWIIKINPGFYDEIVDVPLFVNIEGSGTEVTMIKALHVEGTSKISNLSINNNNPSLIRTSLNNTNPEENNILFSNVKVFAGDILDTNNNPVISINGDGLNNIVTFENSEIIALINNSNPSTSNQVLFDINASLRLSNVNTQFTTNYKSSTYCFNINSDLNVNGGNFELFVNEGPLKEVNLFEFKSGFLDMTNNTSTISVFILEHPYESDVSYIKVENGVHAFISNSTSNLDGVSSDYLNLVENLSISIEINILGLTTPNISIPRLKGIKKNIKYTGISGYGDVVASGGFYGNIINVNIIDHPDGYFLQENDFTIISDNTNIHIFDPALANLQVTDKGKIIIIRNIGIDSITINGQNNSIFDGPQILQPQESIMLQNNGILWYKIGK